MVHAWVECESIRAAWCMYGWIYTQWGVEPMGGRANGGSNPMGSRSDFLCFFGFFSLSQVAAIQRNQLISDYYGQTLRLRSRRFAAMQGAVARVVWATESRVSFAGSLAVTHSVCRHLKYVRSTESGTAVLRHATSSCSDDRRRCCAGLAASVLQNRNANSVSDANTPLPRLGKAGRRPSAEFSRERLSRQHLVTP